MKGKKPRKGHPDILASLLKENTTCADCSDKGPEWACTSMGVFVCTACAGAHAMLGCSVHKLDSSDALDPVDLGTLSGLGNNTVNSALEVNVPLSSPKPHSKSPFQLRESFITAKYMNKAFATSSLDQAKFAYDLQPQTDLLEAGFLQYKNGKSWRTFYSALTYTHLDLYENPGDKEPKEKIQLLFSSLVLPSDVITPEKKRLSGHDTFDSSSFKLVTPSGAHHLRGETKEDAEHWVNAVRQSLTLLGGGNVVVGGSTGNGAAESVCMGRLPGDSLTLGRSRGRKAATNPGLGQRNEAMKQSQALGQVLRGGSGPPAPPQSLPDTTTTTTTATIATNSSDNSAARSNFRPQPIVPPKPAAVSALHLAPSTNQKKSASVIMGASKPSPRGTTNPSEDTIMSMALDYSNNRIRDRRATPPPLPFREAEDVVVSSTGPSPLSQQPKPYASFQRPMLPSGSQALSTGAINSNLNSNTSSSNNNSSSNSNRPFLPPRPMVTTGPVNRSSPALPTPATGVVSTGSNTAMKAGTQIFARALPVGVQQAQRAILAEAASSPPPLPPKPDTIVVLEGYLNKRSDRVTKGWKKRYFVLTNSTLFYYYTKDDFGGLDVETEAGFAGMIDLVSCTAKPSDKLDKKYCIEICTTGTRTYFAAASSSEEMHQWINAIRQTCADAILGVPPSAVSSGSNPTPLSGSNPTTTASAAPTLGNSAPSLTTSSNSAPAPPPPPAVHIIKKSAIPSMIIKSGYLTNMQDEKDKRWFVLSDSDIQYFKSNKEGESPKGTISLLTCTVKIPSDASDTLGFAIVTPQMTYYVLAETVEEARDWVSSLRLASLAFQSIQKADDGNTRGMSVYLQQEIQQFSRDEFATQHFNRSKSKRVFKRKMPTSNLLSWTKDSLPTPLLKHSSSKIDKEALQAFHLVQMYMGDAPSKKSRDKLAWRLLQYGFNHTELRDELYLQISKQTTHNPHPESRYLGWELMVIFMETFPSTKDFESHLTSYIGMTVKSLEKAGSGRKPPGMSAGASDPVHSREDDEKVLKMARYCMERLNARLEKKKAVVSHALTPEELEYFRIAPFTNRSFGTRLEEVMKAQAKKGPTCNAAAGAYSDDYNAQRTTRICHRRRLPDITRVQSYRSTESGSRNRQGRRKRR
eukprot:TRINITY_DN1376_c1_g1_i3.p1 TRINITY_DN1376_c1_g1~~TRINITY_DN1376_c1_g1_i3.p1  ORF type:complete len:1143 (-),score=188.42 TRINITY_DN1376_c1_g1_i3:1037-4465(-)